MSQNMTSKLLELVK